VVVIGEERPVPLRVFDRGNGERQPSGARREEVSDERQDAARGERLCCKACGHAITHAAAKTNINGQHLHARVNPAGVLFAFGAFRAAPGAFTYGDRTSAYSWFPGYTWQLTVCGRCEGHLGWYFTGDGPEFFGLVLEKLVEGE
jgi:hypothetical protein